jgi:PAS domain S-box-containing protein
MRPMSHSDDAHLDLRSQAATAVPEENPGSPFSERLRRAVADLVLETTAESIWLIDAQARTTFVNQEMASLLGYTEEEMIGRSIFEFLDPLRWPVAEQNLRKRELGFEDRREVELIRKDGTRVWVIGSVNPVFDRAGQYAGSLALLGDLTPQKEHARRLQEEINRLRAELAARPVAHVPARAHQRPPEPAPFREPFRTAAVMAVLGTFLATVAMTTAGAVIGSALGKSGDSADEL